MRRGARGWAIMLPAGAGPLSRSGFVAGRVQSPGGRLHVKSGQSTRQLLFLPPRGIWSPAAHMAAFFMPASPVLFLLAPSGVNFPSCPFTPECRLSLLKQAHNRAETTMSRTSPAPSGGPIARHTVLKLSQGFETTTLHRRSERSQSLNDAVARTSRRCREIRQRLNSTT